MSRERLDALRRALDADPANHVVRAMVAELCDQLGDTDGALDAWTALLDAAALPREHIVRAGRAALAAGDLPLADRLVAAAREARLPDADALAAELRAARGRSGVLQLVPAADAEPSADPSVTLRPQRPATFADIGGLEDVKKQIERRIVTPFVKPGLFAKYKRKAGGGVMLFGPPGCGKTLLARATAGECGVPFFAVRIEDILSRWLGESEERLHAVFAEARSRAPCLVFLDELDTIGFARSRMSGSATRSLVDQLLQELDGADANNEGVLILAATNAPWDVDDALQRPGRFDRVVFVPPPDAPARAAILRVHLAGRPVEGVDVADLARRTERFSGADLAELVDRAYDNVIDEAIAAGTEPPARASHFLDALADMRPSTLPWLERARNYVEFANRDGRWEDVAKYLGVGKKGWF